MTVQLPDTLTYGKVVGRFVQAVADGPDAARLPDARPAVGTISFTPAQVVTKELNVVPPTTVIRKPVVGRLNWNGALIDPQTSPLDTEVSTGIWFVAGIYKVSYSLDGASIPGHDIVVTAEHTEQNPLDLTISLPPGGPVVSASQYAYLSSRIDAIDVTITDHNNGYLSF